MIAEKQREICNRYDADYAPPEVGSMVAISDSALQGQFPLHGLRYPPEVGPTRWFIWGGEYSEADDFFKNLHIHHLEELCPAVLPYLALPSTWRFLIAPDYEDVWSDSSLQSA
jgi:hypothetical protein